MEITNQIFAFHNLFGWNQLVLPAGEIRQVTELSIIRGSEIQEHVQQCDEITFAISGKAVFYSGDRAAQLSQGQVHYIRTGVRHAIAADPERNFRYLCIGFIPNAQYAPITELLPCLQRQESFIVQDDGRTKILSQLLLNEFCDWDSHSPEMVNCYLVQLLTTLLRLLQGKAQNPNRQRLHRTPANFAIYHILNYIDREYLQIRSVKDIARNTAYSEYYVSHLFSEKMGMPLKEYINRKKVLHAAALLQDSSISVSEAAEAAGFASAHSFRQAFQRYLQCSPTEYRKKA